MPDELDPRDDAAVRRLLGQARHDQPIPDEVAERIDRALAGLAAGDDPADSAPDAVGSTVGGTVAGSEPDDPDESLAPVVSMARTRRHRAAALLVAAAAIVVIGIGVGQVVRPAGEDATSAADGASTATQDRSDPVDREGDDDAAASRAAEESTPPEAGSDVAEYGAMSADPRRQLLLLGDPPTVREDRFMRDVRSVRQMLRARPARGDRAADAAGFACEAADWGPGRTVAVLYDLAPAVLVLRPATADTQVVDLVQCDSGSVLRSVTLTRG